LINPRRYRLCADKKQFMYRYSLDNTIVYSSDDIVLFKESPFASWMERLTLESPQHGTAPDKGSEVSKLASTAPKAFSECAAVEPVEWEKLVELRQEPPAETKIEQGEGVVQSLGAQGKVVVLIDGGWDESKRRSETLDAMKRGADLIINGQLASGPLSDTAKLLMRRSGFSDLGNYLYIPCDTGAVTTAHSAFRLCFLADLLHSLQGHLPPQMLLIRADSDMVSLQVEDHIYYYRAVKQRFMAEQRRFRKHRMPDPSDSSHFGRWTQCARDVLKQRALGSEGDSAPESLEEEELDILPASAVADSRQSPSSGSAARAAPAAALRPQINTDLTAPSPNPLSIPQDLSFDLDVAMKAGPLKNGRSSPPTASFVDRDRVVAYSDAAPLDPPKEDHQRRFSEDDSLSQYAKKTVRPISSVLITCPQRDY
jgi:hypothetical protein